MRPSCGRRPPKSFQWGRDRTHWKAQLRIQTRMRSEIQRRAKNMSKKKDDEIDWQKLKAGRLEEGKDHLLLPSPQRKSEARQILARTIERSPPRAVASLSKVVHRLPLGQYKPTMDMRASTFHLRHTFIGRTQYSRDESLGKIRARTRIAALKFIEYIERSGEFAKNISDIEVDENGQILCGNIGKTSREKQNFWQLADSAEKRRDARLMCRIVAELPHWVSAAERRKITEKFGEIFSKRKLGWTGAVHKPDPNGDKRNYHLHFVYTDRPFTLDPETGAIEFAKKKDREAQGFSWITQLRENFAAIVNDVTLWHSAEKGVDLERIFYPGRNADLGITRKPGVHIDPKKTAVSRRTLNEDSFERSLVQGQRDGLGEMIRAISLYIRDIKAFEELTAENLHQKVFRDGDLLLSQTRYQKEITDAEHWIQSTAKLLKKIDLSSLGTRNDLTSAEFNSDIKTKLDSLQSHFFRTFHSVGRAKVLYTLIDAAATKIELYNTQSKIVKKLAETDPLFAEFLAENPVTRDGVSVAPEIEPKATAPQTQPADNAQSVQSRSADDAARRKAFAKNMFTQLQASQPIARRSVEINKLPADITKKKAAPSLINGLHAAQTSKEAEKYLQSLSSRDIEVLYRLLLQQIESRSTLGITDRLGYFRQISKWVVLVSAERNQREPVATAKEDNTSVRDQRSFNKKGYEL